MVCLLGKTIFFQKRVVLTRKNELTRKKDMLTKKNMGHAFRISQEKLG